MANSPKANDEIESRRRQGKFVGLLAVAWWIASVGGIIYVINSA